MRCRALTAHEMVDVIYEMSRKGLGITTVVADNKLLGVISDGDLRRLLEKRKDVLSMIAGDCVTANPKTIGPEEFAMTALNIMEQKKITSLVVTQADGSVKALSICMICGERRWCEGGCWLLPFGIWLFS